MTHQEIQAHVGRVVELEYETRSLDQTGATEHDCVEGFFNGNVDAWGKWTFRALEGSDPWLFLFEDEILEIRPLYGEGA